MMSDRPQTRQLPVWTVIQRGFLYAWESRAILMGPYIIYAAITTVAHLLVGGLAKSGSGLSTLLLVAEQIFGMAFAVGIHRFVLLGETPPATRFFRWDRNFLQYLLSSLVLFVLALLVVVPALGLQNNAGGAAGSGLGGAASLLLLTGVTVMGIVLCRLALILPSAALGDQTPIKQIWQATQSNGLRLVATTLLAASPFLFIELILLSLAPAADPASGGGAPTFFKLFLIVIVGLVSPVQLIVFTTVLSLSYDVLVRGGGPRSIR